LCFFIYNTNGKSFALRRKEEKEKRREDLIVSSL
jgi:hypothetical protein